MTTPLEPPLSVSPANRNARLAFLAQLGPFIGLVLIVIFFSVLRSRTFPTLGNAQIILVETAVVATGALGMTMIIISGGIDLSVGSTIALTTVVVALLLRAGWPAWLAALGGTAAAAVCGVVIGLLVTQAHLAPFIVTLGTWGAYRGIAKGLADNTMVRVPGDNWLDHLLQLLGAKQGWMVFPPGIWLTLLMGLIVAAALRYTRFGRHIYAVGSNEQTARLCGVPVSRTKIMVYLVAGVFAGLAGVLQFGRLTEGDPTTANGMELNIIAAVVIGGASLNGGQGSIFGTLIGALLMVVVANGCQKLQMENWTQEIVTGGIIILAAAIDRIQHRRAA